jgi:hypothetical protein
MFRKNNQSQQSLFGPEMILSPGLWARLRKSWAQTFREEVFNRIDEELFVSLYSEKDSRPNAPVNVLVGFEIVKAGEGWSDEGLYEALSFDIRLRYALGIEDVGRELPFTLRTLYNFRSRVREHEQEKGENLYQRVFEQVTDEQLERYQVAAQVQRMDSTQVLSNIVQMKRLELLISVLQVGVKGLEEREQEAWQEKGEAYLRRRPHEVTFGVKKAEEGEHFQRLGALLRELRAALEEGTEAYEVVQRVIREQYKEESGEWRLRAGEEIAADSLQSPHDVEASYRKKNGEAYRGGYVAHVSETCDSQNDLQLITDIQVAKNVTDDGKLLQQAVENQERRGIEVSEAITDGGYNGPELSAFCTAHHLKHHPTTVRGGKTPAGHFGWEAYEWDLKTHTVRCPQGQEGVLESASKVEHWVVHFSVEQCQTCPLLSACRVTIGPRKGASMNPTTRDIEVALLRQSIRPEDKSVRAVVEATVRSLKWPLRKNKLPVRGLNAALKYFSMAAVMVNLRRIHAYLLETTLQSQFITAVMFILCWVFAQIRLSTASVSLSQPRQGISAHFADLKPRPATLQFSYAF